MNCQIYIFTFDNYVAFIQWKMKNINCRLLINFTVSLMRNMFSGPTCLSNDFKKHFSDDTCHN